MNTAMTHIFYLLTLACISCAPVIAAAAPLAHFKGEATGDPHERLYWRCLRRDMWSIRGGDWKLVRIATSRLR